MQCGFHSYTRISVFAALLLVAVLYPAHGQDQPIPAGSGVNSGNNSAAAALAYAQKLRNGVKLYRASKWQDALVELRAARDQAVTDTQVSEALYWAALAEMASSDFEAALRDMDMLAKTGGPRMTDIAYHRGRAYYSLGQYNDAIAQFTEYTAKAEGSAKARVSAAWYWAGESYMRLGQFDKAREIFEMFRTQYRDSSKYEAAQYRLLLINQKKVEQQLLDMIRWSHEDSLKASEEFQRRQRTYELALNAYQKQIGELQKNAQGSDGQSGDSDYRKQLDDCRRQLAEAQNRINALEQQLGIPHTDIPDASGNDSSHDDLMSWAVQLRNTIYAILLQKPDIPVLYDMSGKLDQFIANKTGMSEEDLASMELTITLLKAQYNITL